jgi:hypothetical protein
MAVRQIALVTAERAVLWCANLTEANERSNSDKYAVNHNLAIATTAVISPPDTA